MNQGTNLAEDFTTALFYYLLTPKKDIPTKYVVIISDLKDNIHKDKWIESVITSEILSKFDKLTNNTKNAYLLNNLIHAAKQFKKSNQTNQSNDELFRTRRDVVVYATRLKVTSEQLTDEKNYATQLKLLNDKLQKERTSFVLKKKQFETLEGKQIALQEKLIKTEILLLDQTKFLDEKATLEREKARLERERATLAKTAKLLVNKECNKKLKSIQGDLTFVMQFLTGAGAATNKTKKIDINELEDEVDEPHCSVFNDSKSKSLPTMTKREFLSRFSNLNQIGDKYLKEREMIDLLKAGQQWNLNT